MLLKAQKNSILTVPLINALAERLFLQSTGWSVHVSGGKIVGSPGCRDEKIILCGPVGNFVWAWSVTSYPMSGMSDCHSEALRSTCESRQRALKFGIRQALSTINVLCGGRGNDGQSGNTLYE